MAKKPQPQSTGTSNDPLGIGEIIDAIEGSSLPEHQKMAYLYLLARGDFSLQTLHNIANEMSKLGEGLKSKICTKEAPIEELRKKIKAQKRLLDELSVKTAEEIIEDGENLVTLAMKTAEESAETGKEGKIQALKKHLLNE